MSHRLPAFLRTIVILPFIVAFFLPSAAKVQSQNDVIHATRPSPKIRCAWNLPGSGRAG